jgi:hypothetical protein
MDGLGTYIGGACWISPRNRASASSTFSRVTCRQGAVRTRAPSLSYVSVSQPSKHVVWYSYQSISLRDGAPIYNAHLCAIQQIVQFLGASTNADHYKMLTFDPDAQRNAIPDQIHSPRTPSARGSSVPPCPTFTLSLRALFFLPAVFPSFSSSTKRREWQTSFFNWSTTCMDVGPDGFTMPKSPDRGNGGGVFGILEDTRVGHGSPKFLCTAKGNVTVFIPRLIWLYSERQLASPVLRTYTWTLQSLLSTNVDAQQY